MAFWLKGVSVRRDPPIPEGHTRDHFQLEGHNRSQPKGHLQSGPTIRPHQKAITEGHMGADTPQEQTPPEQTPPGSRHPPETCCKACWDSIPPVNRMTEMSKNITLATTSLRPVKTQTHILCVHVKFSLDTCT